MEELLKNFLEQDKKYKKEKIIDTGKYAKSEIIVGKETEEAPIVEVDLSNCTPIEVAKLIACLEATRETLIKQCPMALLLSKTMDYEYEATTIEK